MRSHYYKTKLTKMGQWATAPLDMETWYGEETNRYFKKLFGIPKGILTIYDDNTGYSHAYVPTEYFLQLHGRIKSIKKKNVEGLQTKLESFYPLVAKAKRAVRKPLLNLAKLSNKELNTEFLRIRHWIHYVVIFDQFGWIAEEGFMPQIEHVLTAKLKLKKDSVEYNNILFGLTTPENISTTLREKVAVLEQAIKIKKQNQTILNGGKILAKKFGWLPVFCYGDPWQEEHYTKELEGLLTFNLETLENKYSNFKNHSQNRNKNIKALTAKYQLNKHDLQIFIDFGLAIDTRNEAEYFVSFGGQFLMPLYKEIAKRLFLSEKQLRNLTEAEMSAALLGKAAAEIILRKKDTYSACGYDEKMHTRINLHAKEAERLFKFIESYVKPIQGGDETKGTCASPGKAVGKIRIVPYPKDSSKVKQGDILVTYATTTDYLPAMKRAAAIITEVGGLTCHAAVVSREFGIPCIVALANAMKNFKDGDMVEVDANKGIVKKL